MNVLQRNIGPILLFLGIVAAGLVGIAWWVTMVRDNSGHPPVSPPSISRLGNAEPTRPVVTRQPVTPTYTTKPARTRVSGDYSRRTAAPTTKVQTPSPAQSSVAGTAQPEVMLAPSSSAPSPEPTSTEVLVEPSE